MDRGVELFECKFVFGCVVMLCKVFIGRIKVNYGMLYGCIRYVDVWNVGKLEVGIKSIGEGWSCDFNEVMIVVNFLRILLW